MMKQYDSYKDSGVEWIGKIPSHWKTLPLKRYGKFGKGLSFTKADLVDEGYPVISYGQIHSKQNSCTGNNEELIRFVPAEFVDHADNSIVSMGDFIFADTSEDLEGSGNAVYIDRDSDIYGGYHTIVFQTENKDNKYLAYLFKTDYWRSQIRSRVSGVKVYSITQSILNLVSIILPPYEEQNAISTYLDKKCGEIDKAIATQEKRVELLKELRQNIITKAVTRGINPDAPLKDSGVEWIGEVPEHWEIAQIKRVASVILGKMLSTEKNNTYEYLCAKDVHYGSVDISDLKEMHFSDEERDIYEVKKGDMLIVEGGAGAGGCAVYNHDKTGVYIQNSIMIVRGGKDVLSEYICYFMRAINEKGYVDYICNTATIPHFSKEKVSAVVIPVPPLSEQQEIVSYIESQTARLDTSIEKAEHQIELLQELKQSIITEVVTGKRKVD